jgi:drug/metabolite transporter (DMT)-like permease
MNLRIYGYIAITIITATTSNVIIKWVMDGVTLPESTSGQYAKALVLLLNPWVWLSIGLTLISALSWMLVMNKTSLSFAFPFLSISYVLIFIYGRIFFGELITVHKIVATLLIFIAMIIMHKG